MTQTPDCRGQYTHTHAFWLACTWFNNHATTDPGQYISIINISSSLYFNVLLRILFYKCGRQLINLSQKLFYEKFGLHRLECNLFLSDYMGSRHTVVCRAAKLRCARHCVLFTRTNFQPFSAIYSTKTTGTILIKITSQMPYSLVTLLGFIRNFSKGGHFGLSLLEGGASIAVSVQSTLSMQSMLYMHPGNFEICLL